MTKRVKFPTRTVIANIVNGDAINERFDDVIIEAWRLEGSRRCHSADCIVAVDEKGNALVVKSRHDEFVKKGDSFKDIEIVLV